jgi:amidase
MSTFPEYETFDAIGLGQLIAAVELSAAEVLQAAIERIEHLNPTINAVCHSWYDEARAVANAALPKGPFSGVPFALKDLHVLYKGQPISNGCRYWDGFVADHDATLTERYRQAGLVILGRTNSTELGLSCETAPILFGPTRNPWDLSRSCGGSSGGAAAAVASGMFPIAHATDGGGSIRIPSFCCGVFGMKVSRGRNPFGPDLGEGWNGLATGHAVSRTVRDNAALLDATHGPAPGDPYAAPAPTGSFLGELERDPGRLRIAFMTATHEGKEVDPQCRRAVEETAALLETLGHHVENQAPRISIAEMKRATRVLVACNVMNVLNMRAAATGREASEQDVEQVTWAWTREALSLSGADYAQAVTTIHRVGREVGAFFESYDVLLTPTFAAPAPPINTVNMMTESLDEYYETLRRYSAFTSLFNVSGGPAMSVPLCTTTDGLPLGLQFGTRLGDEGTLYRLAGQLEKANPWHTRKPEYFGLARSISHS